MCRNRLRPPLLFYPHVGYEVTNACVDWTLDIKIPFTSEECLENLGRLRAVQVGRERHLNEKLHGDSAKLLESLHELTYY